MSEPVQAKILDFLWGFVPVFFAKILGKRKPLSELNILFIDDEHEELSIIRTLNDNREFGKVCSIGDLDNLDNPYLKDADVIFLDIQGVGKKMQAKNGTGLAARIHSKYPKKIITIYSSKPIPNDSHILTGVYSIPKNASYEVFSSHIQSVWEKK